MRELDQKLRNLKNEFNRSVPTSFSEWDKQEIYDKVQNPNQNKSRGLIPKTITVFAFLATALFIIFIFSKDSFSLFESNQGGGPGGLSKGTPIREDSHDEEQASDTTEEYKTELSRKVHVTFNYHLVSAGDEYDLFTVTKVEENEGKKIVTFESDELIYLEGNLIFEDEWLFQFDEYLYGLSRVPIEMNDVGSSVQFKVEDDIDIMGGYVGFSKEKFFPQISLRTKRIDYIFSGEESEILVHVFNTSEEAELYTTPLEIDKEIREIYNEYRHSHDESLLKDFEPIDILKLYLHSASNQDEETVKTLFGNNSTEDLYAIANVFSEIDQFLLVESIETERISVLLDYEPFVDLTIAKNEHGIWKMYHFVYDKSS